MQRLFCAILLCVVWLIPTLECAAEPEALFSGKEVIDLCMEGKANNRIFVLKRGTETLWTFPLEYTGSTCYSDRHGHPNSVVQYELLIYLSDMTLLETQTSALIGTSEESGTIFNGEARSQRFVGPGAASDIAFETQDSYIWKNILLASGNLHISNTEITLDNFGSRIGDAPGNLYISDSTLIIQESFKPKSTSYLFAANTTFTGSASIWIGYESDAITHTDASSFTHCVFRSPYVEIWQPISTFEGNTIDGAHFYLNGQNGLVVKDSMITDTGILTLDKAQNCSVLDSNKSSQKATGILHFYGNAGNTASGNYLSEMDFIGRLDQGQTIGGEISGNTLGKLTLDHVQGLLVKDNRLSFQIHASYAYTDLTIRDNTVDCTYTPIDNQQQNGGIEVLGQSGNGALTIENNGVSHCPIGIFLREATGAVVKNNHLESNSNLGLYLHTMKDGLFEGNDILRNGDLVDMPMHHMIDGGVLLDFASSGNAFAFNLVLGNNGDGIRVGHYSGQNDGNGFHENEIVANKRHGAFIKDGTSNRFYNNYFSENGDLTNYHNAKVSHAGNSFQTAKLAVDANIVGGAYLGGNYWDDYTGTDQDGDGLGDTAYAIFSEHADNLPLLNKKSEKRLFVIIEGQGQVSSSPGGIACGQAGADCKASFAANREVQLTASAVASVSRFEAWSGDCAGQSTSVSVSMSADKTCTARFVAIGEEPDGDTDGEAENDDDLIADGEQNENPETEEPTDGDSTDSDAGETLDTDSEKAEIADGDHDESTDVSWAAEEDGACRSAQGQNTGLLFVFLSLLSLEIRRIRRRGKKT